MRNALFEYCLAIFFFIIYQIKIRIRDFLYHDIFLLLHLLFLMKEKKQRKNLFS